MKFRAKIHVMLKPDVADVQGIAIQQSLVRHDHPVSAVKAGKYFEVELDASDEAKAKEMVEELSNGTFSNPTIEHYWFEIDKA